MVIHLVLGVLLGATAPAATPSTGAGTAPKAVATKPAAKPGASKAGGTAGAPETYAYVRDEKTGAVKKVSLFSPDADATTVVRIGDETITLRELSDALAATHMQGHSGPAREKKKNYAPVLDRLVAARLIVVEAKTTGILELPEVQKSITENRTEALRRMVKARAVQDAKADPAEADRIFQESSVEWKLRSVLVPKEEDAKKLQASLKSGKSFEELAKQLVAEKKAKGNEAPELVAPEKLLPPIAAAVAQLKPGGVTDPIKLPDGYALVKLEAVGHPENAEKRARATEMALAQEKGRALRRYYQGLVKQYVKKDDKLFASVDFEAEKPGFEALSKDKRVLAEVVAAPSITVADLAAEVDKKFYHGVAEAAKSKKINREKDSLFEMLLSARLFDAEAARLKLADSPELKRSVADYTNSLVFGTYVQKVVLPSVKVTEGDLKKYFEKHKADYTYPAFYKLDGIAFKKASDAQSAVDKLNKGTDLGWIRQNAEGQLNPDDQTLHFGNTVTVKALPKDLVPLLATAKKGDYRLYSSPEAQHYVVQVVEYTAPALQKYEEARDTLGEKVFEEKVNGAIQDFAAKLKKAYKPKVLITKLGN